MSSIVLASGSAIRAKILTDAGVPFDVVKPDVDEDILKAEAAAQGRDVPWTAAALARAKALAVDVDPSSYVIGSDQILECNGEPFDKPSSMEEARSRLEMLQGREHALVNGVAVARSGAIIWETTNRVELVVRAMTSAEIDVYLDAAGPAVLTSVGAYQIEKLGARLFQRIDGDYFSALGLALLPLLAFLRAEDALAF